RAAAPGPSPDRTSSSCRGRSVACRRRGEALYHNRSSPLGSRCPGPSRVFGKGPGTHLISSIRPLNHTEEMKGTDGTNKIAYLKVCGWGAGTRTRRWDGGPRAAPPATCTCGPREWLNRSAFVASLGADGHLQDHQ